VKKAIFLFAVIVLAGCVDPTSGTLNEVHTYPQYLWGEWIRMDTGESWYIAGNYISVSDPSSIQTLTRQSEHVIEVKLTSGRTYYLYASRIANASFSGRIAGFTSTERAAANGKGWVNVVVEDLNNGSAITTQTDGEGLFTVPEAIPGDEYAITPQGGTPVTVTPSGDGDDVGTITITRGVNFKTSIKAQNSSTDITRLYANLNAYELSLELENTGTEDCTAPTLDFEVDPDLIVESISAPKIIGTIEPGKKKTIPITLRCKPIEHENEYKKIHVTINEPLLERTWNDSVSVKFHKAAVNFTIKANTAVSGVIISPTAQAYPFTRVTSTTFAMPWSTQDYLVVFSGATADTESAYSFGVETVPDTNFDEFDQPQLYEINNLENEAAAVSTGEKIMAYLHKNDIDYYKVDMGEEAPVVNPISLVDFAYLDASSAETVSNQDDKIQPGESAYLDIMVKNNINASLTLTPAAIISTTSPYVTINTTSAALGAVSSGYYKTLTYAAYPYSNTGGIYSASETYLFYSSGKYNSAAFKFTVSKTCPAGINLPFTITLTDLWGVKWEERLEIPVSAKAEL